MPHLQDCYYCMFGTLAALPVWHDCHMLIRLLQDCDNCQVAKTASWPLLQQCHNCMSTTTA
eukprot:4537439-Prorocentrum_lima.AAC.1